MISIDKIGWLALFVQMTDPTMFLSRFFKVPLRGFYNGEEVAVDIRRFGEPVAIVVKRGTGPRLNDADIFTTKKFKPPSYSEAVPLNVNDLLRRMAGVDPFSDAYNEYAAQLLSEFMLAFKLIDDKIKRGVELQAAQILQTAQLSLIDDNGDVLYELDFQGKATHFPTTGTPWNMAGADPLLDLEALLDVIREDGQLDANIVIMGSNAYRDFVRNQEIKDQLDNRRYQVGVIRPELRDSGGKFAGMIHIGSYEVEIWTYNGRYDDPQTGVNTKYVDPDNAIVLSDNTRLDKTFAGVPLPLGPDPRVEGLLPGRISSREEGMDITPNVYCTPNGKQLMGELESNPLLVPVQIDGYGCLTTR